MKRIFLGLLIAALAVSGTAFADSRAAMLGDRLFLSLESSESGLNIHDERTITHLQGAGDAVYYVAREPVDEEHHQETLMRMNADGSTAVIGETLTCSAAYTYGGNYACLTDYTLNRGYGDMTVYGDHIYYLGNDDTPGSYITSVCGEWGGYTGEFETRYESGASLYRMNLDGSNRVELISGLGNAECHLAIANDVIAVSTAWRNGVYAYDFSDFRLYDLEGNLIREFENTTGSRHSWLYKEDSEFTCIVVSIATDGETIYASLGDSEGDFASSRLTDMSNPGETIAYESYYVPSLLTDDGIVVFTSAAQDEFWCEEMETSLSLQLINPEGVDMLAYIPAGFISWGDVNLSLLDGMVYLSSAGRAIRVPLSGGTIQEFTAGAFETAHEFDPANYPM